MRVRGWEGYTSQDHHGVAQGIHSHRLPTGGACVGLKPGSLHSPSPTPWLAAAASKWGQQVLWLLP